MGFNPDADPATFGAAAPAEAAPGKFDPDADPSTFGATAAAPAPEKEEPSLLEAGARGLKQGVTFGFGDEISGALESAFTSKTYQQARDEARANDKAAREAHPIGFGVGEILGGVGGTVLAPELTALKGAGLAANIARGAGAGIAQGIGDSEADLTKGDVAGVAKDAARGGLIGGTVGGILGTVAGKFTGAAAEAREGKQIVNQLGERATKTTRDRLAAKGESVVEAAQEHGLDKVAREPTKLAAATKVARDEIGPAISEITQAADQVSQGIAPGKIEKALKKVEYEYRKNPATRPQADAIATQIENMKSTPLGEEGGTKLPGWLGPRAEGAAPLTWGDVKAIPSDDVRKFASSLGDEAFAGAGFDPKTTKRMQQRAWGAVKDVLTEHIEKTVPNQAADFARLNRQYSALADIGKAAEYRSRLTGFAPTGLRQIAGHATNVGALGLSLATGNPLPILATAVGKPLAAAAGRGATVALAKLARAARNGNGIAAAAQEALSAGVPRATIEATVSGISGPQEEAVQ